MRRILLCSLLAVISLSVNAQRLEFDSFQAGKISVEALFDRSKEVLGPKETLDCHIEVQIDEKKKLRLEGRKKNGELLFSFGKGNSQMFACDTSDFDGPYFKIEFFDAAQAKADPDNIDPLATIEIFNEECRVDVYIGAMFSDENLELLRFTLSDKTSNSQTAAANRNAINSLKRKLKEILPN